MHKRGHTPGLGAFSDVTNYSITIYSTNGNKLGRKKIDIIVHDIEQEYCHSCQVGAASNVSTLDNPLLLAKLCLSEVASVHALPWLAVRHEALTDVLLDSLSNPHEALGPLKGKAR